jgi:hypothetical protein
MCHKLEQYTEQDKKRDVDDAFGTHTTIVAENIVVPNQESTR